MGGCCSKDKPEGAGDAVGKLNFAGSGCFGGSAPYTMREGGCCQPKPPVGPEWDAALPGLEPILGEVNGIVEDAVQGCCGPHGKLEAAKSLLTEKGWLAKANAHLATHGLVSDLDVFWVYNGQSSSQHMQMRVFTLTSEGGKLAASSSAGPLLQQMEAP
eukprot:COSAG05_NODE_570_length_8623_cov_35.317339_3_plen_159_part_00